MAHKDQEYGIKVMEKYIDIFEDHNQNCASPCSFVSTRAIRTNVLVQPVDEEGKQNSEMKINFKENVKVTSGHYLYSELSLIAEIGGYVGLFLGVSINQVSIFMDLLLSWLENCFKTIKK